MPHYKGWFKTDLPSDEFWSKDTSLTQPSKDKSDKLVLVIKHGLRNYDMVPDYKFRLLNLVVKNQIKAGHKLKIQIFDE